MFTENVKSEFLIYICDDSEEQGKQLLDKLNELAEEFSMKIIFFDSAKKLLDCLKTNQNTYPDILFLDIVMPEMDGITLGKKIKHINEDIRLVFVTAYIEYAIKGYEANAFRYLLKPLSTDMLRELFFEVQRIQHKNKKMLIKTRTGEVIMPIRDILYISAEDKYTVIYTINGHFISDKSLNSYENKLAEFGFYRIHRKYLVNMYHHKEIVKGKVLLSQGCELAISSRRISNYQKQLLQYFRKDLV